MPLFDHRFDEVVQTLPATTGELDELLARATQVARNSICITDARLDDPGPRIVYVNASFERITGYAAAEVIGRTPRFLQGPATDRRVLRRLREDLAAGRPFQGEAINYRKDGTPFHMAWRIAILRDPDGVPSHFVASQDDLTVLRRTEHQLRERVAAAASDAAWMDRLLALGVALAEETDPHVALHRVADVAVRELGARGASIVVADEAHRCWRVAASAGPGQPAPGRTCAPDASSAVGRVLAGERAVVEPLRIATVGAGIASGDHGTVTVVGLGTSTHYGALALTWDEAAQHVPVDRTHLQLLGRLVTMSHRRSEALVNQRALARELQGGLLPVLADLPGLEASWRYLAVSDGAFVGGDWYDAVQLPGGRVALFVGDVAGHGPEAAAVMGALRFTTRGLVRAFDEPGTILDELDASLRADHAPGQAMASLCALVVGPDGDLRYSTAGHPAPVVCRADGRLDVLDGARSRVLGVDAAEPRPTAVDRLGPGDAVLAFSDGAFEARGVDYDDGYRALLARLRGVGTDPDALCDATVGVVPGDHGAGWRDDVVVLAVRRRA